MPNDAVCLFKLCYMSRHVGQRLSEYFHKRYPGIRPSARSSYYVPSFSGCSRTRNDTKMRSQLGMGHKKLRPFTKTFLFLPFILLLHHLKGWYLGHYDIVRERMTMLFVLWTSLYCLHSNMDDGTILLCVFIYGSLFLSLMKTTFISIQKKMTS